MIFLGGLQGLEPAIESDESLKETDPRTLFDYYLNTCPGQGSRTIRTEVLLLLIPGGQGLEYQSCQRHPPIDEVLILTVWILSWIWFQYFAQQVLSAVE